ncbi:LAQU0S10e00672g1_1 [Lachancea quebecensis]|uniref:Phosphatidylinositol N-acetylglucosaminyltransferase subunit GPI19 n=1 Tax=Lachancea quebecensis TaxID=1654605 RepID=A0A0P1KTR5_9SACH|nr:LAQU0S10e00672g1_1 [Lachancea quebecensis]
MVKGVPRREYFGFSQFIFTTGILLLTFVWSLAPTLSAFKTEDASIRNEIITFTQELVELLPQRYWIIVFECVVLMAMLFTYLGLWMYNEDVLTVPLDDMRTITDNRANVVKFSSHQEFLDNYAFRESSGVMDLPITEVCRVLYEKD